MLQHVALEVRADDVEACVAFWAILGFERVELPVTLADRAVWVQRATSQIHLLLTAEPVAPPQGHVAVVVEDYDSTLARLRDAGLNPEPRAEHWGAPRAFVRDSAGHRVELMARGPTDVPSGPRR